MSARDIWRWFVFSLTGRVPVQGGEVTEQHDTPPTVMAPGKEITDPDEAEALGLTASARRMRERRVVGAEEAAGLLGEPDFVDAFTNPALIGGPFDIAHDSEAKRIVRVLMMGSGLNEYGATAIRDAYLAEATGDTVPRMTLRRLVDAARYLTRGRLYAAVAEARRGLESLRAAGLLDQFEDGDR